MSSSHVHRSNGRSYKSVSKQLVDQAIRQHVPVGWSKSYYWRLIDAVRRNSSLLSPRDIKSNASDLRQVAKACARLAVHSREWVHVPESWFQEQQTSRYEMWSSFVDHLLHRYPTPQFFAPIWLGKKVKSWHRDLHFHLGAGKSIRSFDLPYGVRLSKRAARWFMQAPTDLGVAGAIRWAQVKAKGGDERLARYLGSCVGISKTNGWEDFATGAIDFFVREFSKTNEWTMSKEEVHKILVFAYEQRVAASSISVGPWMNDAPVDPEFTLRDWKLRRLRRHMLSWRDSYPRPDRRQVTEWAPSRYQPFEHVTSDRTYQISELCTNRDLKIEGVNMRHCVLTYTSFCLAGTSSIWSLRYATEEDRFERLVTIEVKPSRNEIVQAKAKSNDDPDEFSMGLIRQWAEREGLSIAL